MTAVTQADLGLITITEAATIAGVARTTIYTWITRHGLRTHRHPDGTLLVSEAHLWAIEHARRAQTRGRPRLVAT